MVMFEGFWSFYDKKVGKDKTMIAWFKLTDEEIEKIRNTLPAYLEAHRERKFRKDPVRYLTHKAFNDELPTQSGGHSQNKPKPSNQNNDEPLRFYTGLSFSAFTLYGFRVAEFGYLSFCPTFGRRFFRLTIDGVQERRPGLVAAHYLGTFLFTFIPGLSSGVHY